MGEFRPTTWQKAVILSGFPDIAHFRLVGVMMDRVWQSLMAKSTSNGSAFCWRTWRVETEARSEDSRVFETTVTNAEASSGSLFLKLRKIKDFQAVW